MATEFEQLRLSITLIDDASAGIKAVRAEMRGTTGSAAEYQRLIRDNTKSARVYGDVVGYVDGRLVLLGGSVGYLSSKLDRIGSSLGNQLPTLTAFAKQQQQSNQIAQLLGMSIGQLKSIRSQAERGGISQEDADKIAAGTIDLMAKVSSVGGRTRFQEQLKRSGFRFDYSAHALRLSKAKDYAEIFNIVNEERRNIEKYAIEQEGMDPELAREMGHKWMIMHGLPPTAVAMEELKLATKEYLAEQQRRVDVAEAWLKQAVQLSQNVRSIKGQILVAMGPGTEFYKAMQDVVNFTKVLADNAELWFWSIILQFAMTPAGLIYMMPWMFREGFGKLWELLKKKLSNEMEELSLGVQKINLVMSPSGPGIVPAAFAGGGTGTQGLPGWLQTPGGGGRLPPTPGTGTGGTPGTPSAPSPQAPSGGTPGAAPKPAPTPGTGTGGTPGTPSGALPDQKDRPYYYTGQLTVGGETFQYGTGGGRGGAGKGSSPYGTFPVHLIPQYGGKGQLGDVGRSIGSIATVGTLGGNINDPKYGGQRYGIQIHPATFTGLQELYTAGCFAISKRDWPRFRDALIRANQESGGKLFITVDKSGRAFIGGQQLAPTVAEAAAAGVQSGPSVEQSTTTAPSDTEPAQRYVPNPARMPRMPGESEDAWKARGQRAVERATSQPGQQAPGAAEPEAKEGGFSPIPPGGLPKIPGADPPEPPAAPGGDIFSDRFGIWPGGGAKPAGSDVGPGRGAGAFGMQSTIIQDFLSDRFKQLQQKLYTPPAPPAPAPTPEQEEFSRAAQAHPTESGRAIPAGPSDTAFLSLIGGPKPPVSAIKGLYGLLRGAEHIAATGLPEQLIVSTAEQRSRILDRSVIDRSLQNEIRATVNGSANVDVDVSTPKSGGESDTPLKPITIERQSTMEDAERGPSVEVD